MNDVLSGIMSVLIIDTKALYVFYHVVEILIVCTTKLQYNYYTKDILFVTVFIKNPVKAKIKFRYVHLFTH